MRKSEQTRQTIIEKSAILFNTKGYYGTGMSDIMEATGLSKGGIYGNFETKEEIAIAAFEHNVNQLFEKISHYVKQKKSSEHKLKEVLLFYQRYSIDPPIQGGCPILNTSVEVDDLNEDLRQRVSVALERFEKSLTYIVQRGVDYGEFRSNVNAANFANVFIATLEGALMMAFAKNSWIQFMQVCQFLSKQIESLKA